MVKNISFNGCLFSGVLAYEQSTSPEFCLPGKDKVHFLKYDAKSYQEDEGESEMDDTTDSDKPLWYPYQTVTVKSVEYGEFHRFELVPGDLEQDFSTPGPFGH